MSVLQYDPKKFTMIVGGKIITGFSDGTFVEVERDEDGWMKKIGVDGQITRVRNSNRAGHIVITIMQSSTSNDDLSTFAALDEAAGTGTFPVLAKDSSGRSLFASDTGWVKKYPKTDYQKDIVAWVWTIDCGNLDIFVGGNASS